MSIFCESKRENVIGGSKDAPLWAQFLSFLCSFGQKFSQVIGWCTHSGVGSPVLEILDPSQNVT